MSNTNQQNMITQGTTLVGDIFSEGDFRVEGNIKGNIKTSRSGTSSILNKGLPKHIPHNQQNPRPILQLFLRHFSFYIIFNYYLLNLARYLPIISNSMLTISPSISSLKEVLS